MENGARSYGLYTIYTARKLCTTCVRRKRKCAQNPALYLFISGISSSVAPHARKNEKKSEKTKKKAFQIKKNDF